MEFHADARSKRAQSLSARVLTCLLLPLLLLLSAANSPAQATQSRPAQASQSKPAQTAQSRPARKPPAKPSEAKLLAQAMQVAQSSRLGIEASLLQAIADGRSTQQPLDCVRAADMSFAVDAYAATIEATLAPSEINRALVFFASVEGQGYLKYARSQELRERAVSDPNPKTDLTPAEYRATTAFLGTSAGKKILEAHVLETSELKTSLARSLMSLAQRCGA